MLTEISPATGRMTFRGKVMNRAARIASKATSGKVGTIRVQVVGYFRFALERGMGRKLVRSLKCALGQGSELPLVEGLGPALGQASVVQGLHMAVAA